MTAEGCKYPSGYRWITGPPALNQPDLYGRLYLYCTRGGSDISGMMRNLADMASGFPIIYPGDPAQREPHWFHCFLSFNITIEGLN